MALCHLLKRGSSGRNLYARARTPFHSLSFASRSFASNSDHMHVSTTGVDVQAESDVSLTSSGIIVRKGRCNWLWRRRWSWCGEDTRNVTVTRIRLSLSYCFKNQNDGKVSIIRVGTACIYGTYFTTVQHVCVFLDGVGLQRHHAPAIAEVPGRRDAPRLGGREKWWQVRA